MRPEDRDTIEALRQTIAALNATITSQAETVTYLKWALGILGGALASVCGFFVAWIRTLYDARQAQGSQELKDRDAMLERVLAACQTLAAAVQALRSPKPHRAEEAA